jgi:copper chaperone
MHHFKVEDMTCGHCVSAVERAVKSVDPSAKVAVSLEAKTASIESPLEADAFLAAIEEAGYGASAKGSCCGNAA